MRGVVLAVILGCVAFAYACSSFDASADAPAASDAGGGGDSTRPTFTG